MIAAAVGSLLVSSPAAAPIVDVALRDGADVLAGRLSMDDAAALIRRGFAVNPPDEDGRSASRPVPGGSIRIGDAPPKPGCRLVYEGGHAADVYEAVLATLRRRGFAFIDDERAAPEQGFVLDTLAASSGPIGIVVMFRPTAPQATMFALTLYPSP